MPPEQVVGSSLATKYEYQDGKPVLMRPPKVLFYENFAGKVVGLNLFIGKRPLAAFGNLTGDRQMRAWTQAGDGARLMMLVYHDDPEREDAYGPAGGLPDTKVDTFSQALMDEANQRGWFVISMKRIGRRSFLGSEGYGLIPEGRPAGGKFVFKIKEINDDNNPT